MVRGVDLEPGPMQTCLTPKRANSSIANADHNALYDFNLLVFNRVSVRAGESTVEWLPPARHAILPLRPDLKIFEFFAKYR
mmetsp:Transcript_25709/g.40665  ORF Transcript_25709/g.40665 Transcript_25709/m.40665 type:complete len:81 (-) Transcript_25709:50-292(-)